MNEWHLLRPLWLIALPAGLLLLWWYRSRRLSAGRWRDVVDEALQPYVLTGGADKSSRWLSLWQALVFSVLVLALAGPVRDRLPQPVYRDNSALIIALDLSRSMNAQDVLPTRLERARLKVRDLLSERTKGDTALIVFAGDAFTVTPLTDDTATIEAMLESLTTQIIPRQGSLLAPALMRAGRLFDDAGATQGRVLVLADGLADRDDAAEAARQLAERGFETSVLGIGTSEGDVVRNADGELIKDSAGQIVVARTDAAALASVSAAGDGRFTMLSADDSDLTGLLASTEEAFADGVLSEDFETDVWREEGPLLVLLCLPLVALLFRRGVIACLACFMLLPAPRAQAGFWQDLWANPDQQAAASFKDEDYAAAVEKFADPAWQAAAAFRAGDYEKSAQILNEFNDAESNYNRGNALALAGDIEGAKSAYERALEEAPKHEDARHNLDVLNQIPPQEQEQQDGEGESSEQEQGEQGEEGGEQGDNSQSGDSGDSSESDSGDDGEAGQNQPPEDDQDGMAAEDREGEGDEQEPGEAQEQAEDQPGEDGDERLGEVQQAQSDEEAERDLAAEQWLRQVPDDPGGLLRRKFERQYRLRYQGRPEEAQAW
ncbi:MAG: VWA domain-containing protein [Gammaproteobacteria bacterium]